MKNLVLILSLVLGFSANAASKVLVDETTTHTLKYFENLYFKCSPGVASNGHNYPTASSFDIYVGGLLVNSNSSSLGMIPFGEPLGDHCADLKEEVKRMLPADLVVRRVVKEQCTVVAGENVKTISEEVTATLGRFQLVDSKGFFAGPCTP